jgi:glucose/mannose transport system permease protein
MSGFVMALYLAGLRAINDELREAARVDGASEARLYRHIVIPLLRPITVSAIVLLGYVSLKMFDLVFVLTRGGPALSSDLPSIFMFDTTFRSQAFAQGAAVATIMFIVSAVVIVPYLWAQLRQRPT